MQVLAAQLHLNPNDNNSDRAAGCLQAPYYLEGLMLSAGSVCESWHACHLSARINTDTQHSMSTLTDTPTLTTSQKQLFLLVLFFLFFL